VTVLGSSFRRWWLIVAAFMLSANTGARADDGEHRSPPTEQAPPQRETHRAAAITMVVVGGLAVAGGIVALGLDQDGVPAPPGVRQEQYYWDTTPAGIAAVATGTVVAGIGVYLFFRDRKRATRPQVAPLRDGGAIVGFAGSF